MQIFEEQNTYLFIVNNKEYRFGKTLAENQTQKEYLQSCKREVMLLEESLPTEERQEIII